MTELVRVEGELRYRQGRDGTVSQSTDTFVVAGATEIIRRASELHRSLDTILSRHADSFEFKPIPKALEALWERGEAI